MGSKEQIVVGYMLLNVVTTFHVFWDTDLASSDISVQKKKKKKVGTHL